jgi:TetR/AcrR family transcriptional regulator, regulator of autoinduction and epiphytic fitness
MQAMSANADRAPAGGPRRPYNSTRRARQAAQTRDDVLAAAIRRFTDAGWAGTTMSSVATEAGVAVETVYSGFRSKKGLLRAAMDAAVVGDADPVPFVERDEFRRLGRGPRSERVDAGVRVQTDIHERSAGVWRAITEAAACDPEVDGWRIELERRRRVDLERSVTMILGRPLDERTIDLLWVIFGPEVYRTLTVDLGLDRAAYEDHVRDAFDRLTAPAARSGRPAAVPGR